MGVSIRQQANLRSLLPYRLVSTQSDRSYSPHWSCPIPPMENRLKVPIRAGEKTPVGEWVELEPE